MAALKTKGNAYVAGTSATMYCIGSSILGGTQDLESIQGRVRKGGSTHPTTSHAVLRFARVYGVEAVEHGRV